MFIKNPFRLLLLAEVNWSSLQNGNPSWAKATGELREGWNGQLGLHEIQTSLCTFLHQQTSKTMSPDYTAKLLDTLQFLLLISSLLTTRSWTNACRMLVRKPSPGGLPAATLGSELWRYGGWTAARSIPTLERGWEKGNLSRAKQAPLPSRKHPSCNILEGLRCRAAPALPEEPAGFSFFTVRTGREKLIKPQPEGRRHRPGQPKRLAQQTHRQQPSLRPRLNNYWQPVVRTRQSWWFLFRQTNCPGKAHHPQALFHQHSKSVSCKLLEAQKLQMLGSLSLKAFYLNLSHYTQAKLYLAEWESYKPHFLTREREQAEQLVPSCFTEFIILNQKQCHLNLKGLLKELEAILLLQHFCILD